MFLIFFWQGKSSQSKSRNNERLFRIHLKPNGIFFVREFPFYFNLHFKLHDDIKVNTDPSIFASPCLCKKTKPRHTVFFCMCSHGILRAGKDNFGASNSGNQIFLPSLIKLFKPTFPSLEAGASRAQEAVRVRFQVSLRKRLY